MRSIFSSQNPDVVETNERYSFELQLALHKLFTSAKKRTFSIILMPCCVDCTKEAST